MIHYPFDLGHCVFLLLRLETFRLLQLVGFFTFSPKTNKQICQCRWCNCFVCEAYHARKTSMLDQTCPQYLGSIIPCTMAPSSVTLTTPFLLCPCCLKQVILNTAWGYTQFWKRPSLGSQATQEEEHTWETQVCWASCPRNPSVAEESVTASVDVACDVFLTTTSGGDYHLIHCKLDLLKP